MTRLLANPNSSTSRVGGGGRRRRGGGGPGWLGGGGVGGRGDGPPRGVRAIGEIICEVAGPPINNACLSFSAGPECSVRSASDGSPRDSGCALRVGKFSFETFPVVPHNPAPSGRSASVGSLSGPRTLSPSN